MIKGAIFDFDGTILDSMFVWSTLGETYLRSLGYAPKEDINAVFKSVSLYQAACYYISEYGVEMTVEEVMADINKRVENDYFYKLSAKDGINNFLSELSKKGVKMCIATATDRYQVDAALKRLKLDGYFSNVFTCTQVGTGKEKPDIYRQALKFLGTDKSNTVVFEDALYAIQTAKADGFFTVGIYDRYAEEQDEIRALADVYLTDYFHTKEFWKFAENL